MLRGRAGSSRGKQLWAHRSHEAGQPPLSAEEAVAVKSSTAVHTALQHIDSHDTGVHRIWVLPHSSLDDRGPWVTGGKIESPSISKQSLQFVTCARVAVGSRDAVCQSEMKKGFCFDFN